MNRRSFITKIVSALLALPFTAWLFRNKIGRWPAKFVCASKPLHPGFGIAIQHKKLPAVHIEERTMTIHQRGVLENGKTRMEYAWFYDNGEQVGETFISPQDALDSIHIGKFEVFEVKNLAKA